MGGIIPNAKEAEIFHLNQDKTCDTNLFILHSTSASTDHLKAVTNSDRGLSQKNRKKFWRKNRTVWACQEPRPFHIKYLHD
jgi:hypothetical protein